MSDVSSLSKVGVTKTGGALNPSGTITQTERLFTNRARYAQTKLVDSRGQHAYIKLLTSSRQAKEYSDSAAKQTRSISHGSEFLVGKGSDVATMSDSNVQSGYDKFLVTDVSCQMAEKTQIMEVFGDHEVVYYFGRQPVIFNISGLLIDSPDNNWFTNWLSLYSDFLRGSQLAKNYELLKIVLPNMVITGTISGFSWSQNAARDTDIPFNFQFIAKSISPTPGNGQDMISSSGLKLLKFNDVTKFTKQAQLNAIKEKESAVIGVFQDPSSTIADKAAALSALASDDSAASKQKSWLDSAQSWLSNTQKSVESADESRQATETQVEKSGLFSSVTSSLSGVQLKLLSPVYGVLNSLTQLVTNTGGSVISLTNKLTNGVVGVLKGITKIANQVTALANAFPQAISDIKKNFQYQSRRISSEFSTALASLKKAKGAIAKAPENTAQAFSKNLGSGSISGSSPVLATPAKLSFTRPILNIPGMSLKTPAKIDLLRGISSYNYSSATL